MERAKEYIQGHLQRKNQEIRLKNLSLTTDLEELGGAGVIIEAIPEDLTLKQNLFGRLDEICPPPTVLASNTSTLPLTALAAATRNPERVAGMHFFNPAPVLPLVEVVRAAQSGHSAIQDLVDLANILGKTAVVANDTPGFIVNRVARPFYGEALRLVAENVATFRQVDQLVRLGGGFRMGPFELMDLIGIDVNLAAMQSMYEQTFGEPRYRPNPIQARMVQQKTLGRKTGRGFYSYTPTPESQECILPEPRHQKGVVRFSSGTWAPGVLKLFRKAGYSTSDNNVPRHFAASRSMLRAYSVCDGLRRDRHYRFRGRREHATQHAFHRHGVLAQAVRRKIVAAARPAPAVKADHPCVVVALKRDAELREGDAALRFRGVPLSLLDLSDHAGVHSNPPDLE